MTILFAIVMLGVLIFVHELGHFIFAKAMGVGVLKFSLGFGPKIVGRKIGETEYMLSAFPLGGYVKMLGEDTEEVLTEEENQKAFHKQTLGKRALIVLAGPIFNILLAYVVFTAFLSFRVPVTVPNLEVLLPVVQDVIPGSPADDAGLKAGDKIIEVDGEHINVMNEFQKIVSENKDHGIKVLIKRGDETVTVPIRPEQVTIKVGDSRMETVWTGIEQDFFPVIGNVRYNSPASRSGILNGDKVLAVDGTPVRTWFDMVNIIQVNPGRSILISVERNGQVLEMPVTPEEEERTIDGEKKVIGLIGVEHAGSSNLITSESVPEAVYKGAIATYQWSAVVFDTIAYLIRGKISYKTVGGPITIVRESGKAAAFGVLAYLMFMAVISIHLGILNLLPIPILDGGHLLLFLIQGIKGNPLNEKAVNVVNRIGLAFLLALMVLAFYNDIVRLLTGK